MLKYSQFHDHDHGHGGGGDVSFEFSLNKRFQSKESWSIGQGFGLTLKGSVILQAGQVKSDK
jgi:hypothetical protein